MNNNEQIITDIINDLEVKDELRFNKRITKKGLILCWSTHANMDEYFGYSASKASRALGTLFSIEKASGSSWYLHILYLYGYKYCPGCTSIVEINNFGSVKWNAYKLSSQCKSCERVRGKQYRADNKEEIAERYIEYRHNNKEKLAEYHKQYRKDNLGKKNASSAKRSAAKLKRTPCWLTQNELNKIQDLYKLSKQIELDTGIKQHVDHIIPLQGELVSGLHVYSNLQVIPATDNLSKSNTFEL